MQMRFSGNAPPTRWLPSIISIPDLESFATELALAAVIRNVCHIAARKVAVLALPLQLPPGTTPKWPEIEPDWPPKGRVLAPHIICISLKFLHTSLRETPIGYSESPLEQYEILVLQKWQVNTGRIHNNDTHITYPLRTSKHANVPMIVC